MLSLGWSMRWHYMKLVLLAGDGISTDIVYHCLSKVYPIEKVIIEAPVSKKKLLQRRIKTLGARIVFGQILFQILVVPFMKKKSHKRIQEILDTKALSISKEYKSFSSCVFVESVNSVNCKELLQELNPDIVIVNGTRIISQEILECTEAVFINMHAGITPKYRGVHGAYWALFNKDPEYCGVTVHLVDKGIDTGEVLYQGLIQPSKKDNFCTYPYLQTAVGVKLEIKAIQDCIDGTLKTQVLNLPSKLYSHPTIWQYLKSYIKDGIK